MPEITLEPFAAEVVFYLKSDSKNDDYRLILADFLETIAARCEEAGADLIGHIKGLVLGEDKSYLKISVISASLPANIEGTLNPATNKITLNLNVIVYGLISNVLDKIVRETAAEFEREHFESTIHLK